MRIIDELAWKYDLKLDRKGYGESIMTENTEVCFNCKRPAENWHELQFGTADRKKSKALGLWVPLCADCHRKAHARNDIITDFHKLAQQECDRWYGEGTFFKVFGRNYL